MMYKIVIFLTCLSSSVFASESQLIVVRHGEGAHNISRTYNTNPFHPNYVRSDLTEMGKRDVQATAVKLLEQGFNKDTIDLVVVSPLPRTLQTAKILCEQGVISKDKIVIDSRVIEPNLGNLEGQAVLSSMSWATMDHKSLSAETVEEMQQRLKSVYGDILRKNTKGHVLVITHGTTGYYLLQQVSKKGYYLKPAEAKVVQLKLEEKGNTMSQFPIILASQSAIRQRALNLLNLQYQCIPSHIDEKAIRDPDPFQMALRISEAKAREIAKNHHGLIVSGDAFCLHKGKIMEKPATVEEGRTMLKELSGSTFTFITALVVYNTATQQLDKAVESCDIQFRELSDHEIDDYISKYPVTKFAGGHETDGAVRFAVKIEGNLNIITALPMDKLTLFLRKNGVKI